MFVSKCVCSHFKSFLNTQFQRSETQITLVHINSFQCFGLLEALHFLEVHTLMHATFLGSRSWDKLLQCRCWFNSPPIPVNPLFAVFTQSSRDGKKRQQAHCTGFTLHILTGSHVPVQTQTNITKHVFFTLASIWFLDPAIWTQVMSSFACAIRVAAA